MKLYFDRSDSFYKIFKSIEKIPDWKKIQLEIHPHNQFFKNIRWWKQLLELLKEKKIDYTIFSSSDFVQSYFQELWEKPELNKDSSLNKTAQLIYNFFFNIKKFHLEMMSKKDYLSFFILWIEAIIWLIALYIFWIILIPSAMVSVKPSYNVEEVAYNFRYYPVESPLWWQDAKFISIPYYKSSIEHEMNFAVPLSDLKYNVINSKGFAKFTNNLNTQITLKPNSKLETTDGLLFKSLDWIILPGKWSVTIPVEAFEKDDKEEIIWTRWNILAWTKMQVKNLQWAIKSQIDVVATINFSGWKFFTEWIISDKDIATFQEKAKQQLAKIKRDVLIKQVKTENIKPLFFDDMIDTEWFEVKLLKKVWDVSNVVDGTIKAKLVYRYIYRDELMSAVYKYTSQRTNKSFNLIEIDRWSIILYDRFVSSTGVYIIPTKVNTIRWYNFITDVAWIKNQIKSKISWMEKTDAIKTLLTFPNISAADVKISPFWIEKVPNVISRIKIDIVK